MADKKRYYVCVTPFFPSKNDWRGAYVLDQVKAIRRHGNYEVLVFKTNSLKNGEADYDIEGIHVHCMRPLLMPSYVLNGATEKLVGQIFAVKLRLLGIDVQRIAVVHCHTCNHAAFGFGVKRVNSDVKVVLQFHDLDPLTLRNGFWAHKKWNRSYRVKKSISVLERADLLLCISQPVKETVLAFPKAREHEVYESALAFYKDIAGYRSIKAIKPKQVYVLNNGVDTSVFFKQKREVHREFRIGCVANFQELKDHATLVRAFKLLVDKGYSNLKLSLLGKGETRADIERLIEENDLNSYVEWPEEVRHEMLPAYYNSLDLFVLPSRFEGFGCVYTEAYACGVPFICCEHQGAAELIRQEERELWLAKDKNPEHLAGLIEHYYLERAVQNLEGDYDLDRLIPKYLNFLDSI